MKNHIKTIFALSSIAMLITAKGNEEKPLPLGASDLVPNQHFDHYRAKETKIKPIKWLWNSESVELVYEDDNSSLSEFQFADQWSVAALQVENEKLKKRVADLESRLAKLEGHLTTKERTSQMTQ